MREFPHDPKPYPNAPYGSLLYWAQARLLYQRELNTAVSRPLFRPDPAPTEHDANEPKPENGVAKPGGENG